MNDNTNPDQEPVKLASPISAAEIVYAVGILVLAVGFGVSMLSLAPQSTNTGRARMADQFIALITLQGPLVPIASAFLCIVGIVVLVILSNRATARRRKLLQHQTFEQLARENNDSHHPHRPVE